MIHTTLCLFLSSHVQGCSPRGAFFYNDMPPSPNDTAASSAPLPYIELSTPSESMNGQPLFGGKQFAIRDLSL